MGYGAMQLAGQDGDKMVWGPPRDIPGAIAVLREAVASGVNHIDTSDFYGPHVTNQIIKRALHPYPDDLVIVTKVGARRGADGSWLHARSRQEIIDAVHDNLRNLGLDALQVVNLRLGGFAAPEDEPFEEPLSALVELKRQGLVQHIGLSTVSPSQLAEAQAITEIVCIQNLYNVAQRGDESIHRRSGHPRHCLRALLPARRVLAASVGSARRGGGVPPRDADAGRSGLAASAGPQHASHSRYLVDRPSPRESCGCDTGTSTGNDRQTRQDRERHQIDSDRQAGGRAK
jgi:hypothetical protein